MTKFGNKLGEKNWVVIGAVLVMLFSVGLALLIIFFGAAAGDPRGEQLGPGP